MTEFCGLEKKSGYETIFVPFQSATYGRDNFFSPNALVVKAHLQKNESHSECALQPDSESTRPFAGMV